MARYTLMYQILSQFLVSGKAVYVEKPPGANYEEIKKVYEHSEKSGKTLFAAFQK